MPAPRWIVLCDTNGGTMPEEVEAIVRDVVSAIPGDHLGIHAHDDTGQAVAQSLSPRARRRAPDPGHAQRHRRAVGQRQPHLDHPDAAAEGRLRRPLPDRHQAGRAGKTLTSLSHCLRRAGQPRPQPAGALRRCCRLHHQGGDPAPRRSAATPRPTSTSSRSRRQPPAHPGLRPGRQGRTVWRNWRGWASTVDQDDARLDALLRAIKRARVGRLCLRGRRRLHSSFWRGRTLGHRPYYFDVESFHVTVERRHNALGSGVRLGGGGES